MGTSDSAEASTRSLGGSVGHIDRFSGAARRRALPPTGAGDAPSVETRRSPGGPTTIDRSGETARAVDAAGYEIRTVRVGVHATVMALALLALLPMLPGGPRVILRPYVVLLVAAAAGTGIVAAMPWRRLFDAGWGHRAMYAWSTLDIVLITGLAALSGGPSTEIVLLYFLTTVFFAASYPLGGQVALFAVTCASYLTLALAWDPRPPLPVVVARLGALAMVWFMAAFLARERLRAAALAEHRADLLAAVVRANAATAVLDADQVMSGVVDSLCAIGFDFAAAYLLETGADRPEIRHIRGAPRDAPGELPSNLANLVDRVLEGNETMIVSGDPPPASTIPRRRRAGADTLIAGPIRIDGDVVGVLVASNRHDDQLARADAEAFELLAGHVGRSLENARRFQAQHHLTAEATAASLRDDLTGIGNRRRANLLLDALQPGDTVVLVDLDHFKDINDTLGHTAGDQTLIEVADHLRSAIRDVDDLARYGGDEFLLVLRGTRTDPSRTVERLLDTWRERNPATTFSAGLAVHANGVPPTTTIARADAALYEAKQNERNRVCAHGPPAEVPDSPTASPG